MKVWDDTSWSLVGRAAAGERGAREEFARRYEPFVRSYLASRWGGTPALGDLDDAVQEVFLDCFRENGVLERADPEKGSGFRAFLCGVIRIVVLRTESRRAKRRAREAGPSSDIERQPDPGDTIGTVLDRAWARTVLSEAMGRLRERADVGGDARGRRFHMLELRYRDGLPVADVGTVVGLERDSAKRELSAARREFERTLLDVVAAHHPGTPGEVRREAERLLASLE